MANDVMMIGPHPVRRDGEMWCLTDLWRAGGAPENRRPAEWLRKDGAGFVEFLRDSLDVAQGHIVKTAKKGGRGGGGDTWAHWQVALAYAKAIDHAFHARVNDVYRAHVSGQLGGGGRDSDELVAYKLRAKAIDDDAYESVWTVTMKKELARLRGVTWDGTGIVPKTMTFAFGRTWRIVLGNHVYDELKIRNPQPKSGSLHGHWLTEQAHKVTKKQDLVIALFIAERSIGWSDYERDLREHFDRTSRVQFQFKGFRGVKRLPRKSDESGGPP